MKCPSFRQVYSQYTQEYGEEDAIDSDYSARWKTMIVKVKNTQIGSEELKPNRLDTRALHTLSKSAFCVNLRIH